MKRLAAILLVSLLTMSTAQAEINFEHLSLEQTLEKARETNKLIFIDVYATWCGPCKMLSNSTFKDDELGRFMNENFINVKIDGETDEGRELMYKYELDAYPTMLFIDGDMEFKEKVVGFVDPEELLTVAKETANPETSVIFQLEKRFENGERDKDFLQELILESTQKEKNVDAYVSAYMELYPELDLLAENEFIIFCYLSNDLSDELVQEFLKSAEDLHELHQGLAEYKLVQILFGIVETAKEAENQDLIKENVPAVYPAYLSIFKDEAHSEEELTEFLEELFLE